MNELEAKELLEKRLQQSQTFNELVVGLEYMMDTGITWILIGVIAGIIPRLLSVLFAMVTGKIRISTFFNYMILIDFKHLPKTSIFLLLGFLAIIVGIVLFIIGKIFSRRVTEKLFHAFRSNPEVIVVKTFFVGENIATSFVIKDILSQHRQNKLEFILDNYFQSLTEEEIRKKYFNNKENTINIKKLKKAVPDLQEFNFSGQKNLLVDYTFYIHTDKKMIQISPGRLARYLQNMGISA